MNLSTRALALAAGLAATAGALAAPFSPGTIVVVRVGDGSAALSSAATAVFLTEIRLSDGMVLQSIPMPTTVSGIHRALTTSGSATSEGFLSLSAGGTRLTMGGYDAPVGTTGVATTASATVNRVVAIVDSTGAIDTSNAFADAYDLTNIRSAVVDGTNIWTSGAAGMGTVGGIRHSVAGSGTTVQLAATPTNLRVLNIFAGQLYTSSASGMFQGVSAIGTGLPTTAGQTITLLSGFPTATGPSSYDFYLADASTVYVADDRSLANGGGLQKWTFDGAIWTLAYTMNTGLTAGLRGLTGKVEADVLTLYATSSDGTTAANGNKLVSVVDSGMGSMFNVIATAPGNTAYRGLDFPPPFPNFACYANCDNSTAVPFLNVNDFTCFLNEYAAGATDANCDGSTTMPVLNVNDFTCFLNTFAAGCSAP